MQRIIKTGDAISLGISGAVLKSSEATRGFPYRTNRSYVQLYFMHKSNVVVLYRGTHPILYIDQCDMRLQFDFETNGAPGDVADLIEQKILDEAVRILTAAKVTINRGKQIGSLGYDYHSFEVLQESPIQGLTFDPQAVAYTSWFDAPLHSAA